MNTQNVLQMIGILIVFVLILFATYYVTKWVAKSGMVQNHAENIKVIETFRIAQNKYIQIIQIGSRYCAIAVSKDQITFLTELNEEELNLSSFQRNMTNVSFREMLGRMKKENKKDI